MKKNSIFRWLLLTVWLVLLSDTTAGASNEQKVMDLAEILTQEEEADLQEQLYRISETYQCDVAAVTTDSCEGKSPQDYTDDFYEEAGYGYGASEDGIILMISMGERQFHLATRGLDIRIFTDYGLEVIDHQITGDLSDGAYAHAFETYGDLAETFIKEYQTTGMAFDTNHTYKEKMGIGVRAAIAAAVGIVLAALVVSCLYAQLRTVRTKNRAHEYVRSGSFRVTRERDVYLYSNVSKTRKPEDNGGGGGGSSTHTTSSGKSAGGRTGSF